MNKFEFCSDEWEHCVFEALGAASTCWDTLEHAGVFHSDRAVEIGNALVAKIKETFNEQLLQNVI